MKETQRLWLMFPTKLVTRPIIWELGKTFDVVTNMVALTPFAMIRWLR